jgi:DHA2 family multidrug resistance protein
VTTMLARQSQSHQTILAAHVTPYDPQTQQTLFGLLQHMAPQQALGVLYGRVIEQSTLWAFVSNFRAMAFLCFACIALAFVFRKAQAATAPIEVH